MRAIALEVERRISNANNSSVTVIEIAASNSHPSEKFLLTVPTLSKTGTHANLPTQTHIHDNKIVS